MDCRQCTSPMRFAIVDGKKSMTCLQCGRVVPLRGCTVGNRSATDTSVTAKVGVGEGKAKTGPRKPTQRQLPGLRGQGRLPEPVGSTLEEQFLSSIKTAGLPDPEREVKFDTGRRWRFDFAYPKQWIAMECEGGTWSGGRHTSGRGFRADCQKYNRATFLGWMVFRFDAKDIREGVAAKFMAQVWEEYKDADEDV